MFSLGGKKEEAVLIYDIGNLSVGGALAIFSGSEPPKIIYATRESVKTPEKPGSDKLLAAVSKSLENVSRDIEKNGLKNFDLAKPGIRLPQRAFCVLSSPWYASQTRVVTLKKDKSFIATKKLLNELVADETNSFRKSLSQSGAANYGKTVLVESEVVDVKLNGYGTDKPEGKPATVLTASVFLSVAPEEVLGKFAEKIKKVFNLEKIFFNTFPLAAFSAVKKAFGKSDFIFADVSGETTDVLLAKNGNLAEIITFPAGKSDFVRNISDKMKTSPEEALSLFYLYHEEKLSADEKARVGEVVRETGEGWLKLFREALVEIGDGFFLPNTVLFTADKDAENCFGSLIKKEDYGQFTLTESPFTIKPLSVESLSGACKTEGVAKRDSFLMIGAVYASKK